MSIQLHFSRSLRLAIVLALRAHVVCHAQMNIASTLKLQSYACTWLLLAKKEAVCLRSRDHRLLHHPLLH